MDLTRKEFLVLVIGGAAAAACGGSGSPAASGNCLADGTTANISQNTGHVLIVSKEDVAAGVQKSYDIRGTDQSHTHTVTLTPADMQKLAQNQPIQTTSTVDGNPAHSHQITVSCV